jgi:hypothetical protein
MHDCNAIELDCRCKLSTSAFVLQVIMENGLMSISAGRMQKIEGRREKVEGKKWKVVSRR